MSVQLPDSIDAGTLAYETRIGDLVKWANLMKLRVELRLVRTRAPRNGVGRRKAKKK